MRDARQALLSDESEQQPIQLKQSALFQNFMKNLRQEYGVRSTIDTNPTAATLTTMAAGMQPGQQKLFIYSHSPENHRIIAIHITNNGDGGFEFDYYVGNATDEGGQLLGIKVDLYHNLRDQSNPGKFTPVPEHCLAKHIRQLTKSENVKSLGIIAAIIAIGINFSTWPQKTNCDPAAGVKILEHRSGTQITSVNGTPTCAQLYNLQLSPMQQTGHNVEFAGVLLFLLYTLTHRLFPVNLVTQMWLKPINAVRQLVFFNCNNKWRAAGLLPPAPLASLMARFLNPALNPSIRSGYTCDATHPTGIFSSRSWYYQVACVEPLQAIANALKYIAIYHICFQMLANFIFDVIKQRYDDSMTMSEVVKGIRETTRESLNRFTRGRTVFNQEDVIKTLEQATAGFAPPLAEPCSNTHATANRL